MAACTFFRTFPLGSGQDLNSPVLNRTGQPRTSSRNPHHHLPPFRPHCRLPSFPVARPMLPFLPGTPWQGFGLLDVNQCCYALFHSLPVFFQCVPIYSICLIIWTIGGEPRSRKVPAITPPCQPFPELGNISCQDAHVGSFRPGKGSPRSSLPQAGFSRDALLAPAGLRGSWGGGGRKKGERKDQISCQKPDLLL